MQIRLASLDAITLDVALRQRILTLQGVPTCLRSALRTALRAGLQLITDRESPQLELRGWKLFCLAPRMLVFRAAGDAGRGRNCCSKQPTQLHEGTPPTLQHAR